MTERQSSSAGTSSSDPITAALDELRDRIASDARGSLADYIPQLATADPSLFGLALASLEGRLYQAGDATVPFTIQSVSKPFVYALALADLGLEEVLSRVGAEPSGEAFNAISLELNTGRPSNPMVNAGAIVTASLVRATDPVERFERIRETLSAFAGRPLDIDETVFASELQTGDRNRALAYLMRNAGSLRCPVDEAVEVYFRQCSLLVTAADVAVMAATLANGGVNPCTGKAVVAQRVAEHVLAVMATCGMYDYSGEWLLRVGLPAKSGVSGGLIAVSPGQFGIGLFSPPLDARGNSVRAVAASHELAGRFEIHLMHQPGRSAPVLHRVGSAQTVRSSRRRRRQERDVLDRWGSAISIRGVQGDIEFAAAEIVLRCLRTLPPTGPNNLGWLALDLNRTSRLHPVAARLLEACLVDLKNGGLVVAVADEHRRGLIPCADIELPSPGAALEWCEDALLESHGALLAPGAELPLQEHDVMASLDDEARGLLARAMTGRTREVGDWVFAHPEEVLFLILSGRVAAHAQEAGAARRLGSQGAGTAVCRAAGPGDRSGDCRFIVELPTSGMMLTQTKLDELVQEHPGVVVRLLRVLAAASHPWETAAGRVEP